MTFKRELFSEQLIHECLPLFQIHYEQVAHFHDIPLDPDLDLYAAAEINGILRFFVAREEGQVCGYAIFFVRANPHYRGSIQANQDIIFLAPEMRKGFSGARFIKWCDSQLKNEGVQVVYQHSKLARDFGSLLKRLGYEAIETSYAKRLDEWEND